MKIKTVVILSLIFILWTMSPVYGDTFDKSLNVPLDKVWTVKFNKNIDPASITSETIYIQSEDGNKFNIKYYFEELENINQVKLLHEDNLFEPQKKYTIHVKNVKGINGEKLAEEYTKEFITKSIDSSTKRINLDKPGMEEYYKVRVLGTIFHPFSYDPVNKEHYTYVVRGLASIDERGNLEPYPVPENIVFTKTLDIYSLVDTNDYLIENYQTNLTIEDLKLYQQTIMEFTKEKPYWVEKVSFKKLPKNHGILFYVIHNCDYDPSMMLFEQQQFHFMNSGMYKFTRFSSEEANTHLPLNEIFNNELLDVKEYRKIYENHGINKCNHRDSFGDFYNEVRIIERNDDFIYYNLINAPNQNQDGGYIYNRKDGTSKKILDGWIDAIDEKNIYYTKDHIIKQNKEDGSERILYCKPESPCLEYFVSLYLHDEYIYAYNRFSPGEIWRIKNDGTNPKLIVKSYQLQDGFAVSEDGVFYALDDGIYQATLDGLYNKKIVDGEYIVLYCEDGYLYYRKAEDFYDYDEYRIKVSSK